jgi:outer membrane protein TolC
LDAAIAIALEHNLGYRMAQTDVATARGLLREQGAPRTPDVSVSDAFAYTNPVAQLSTPFGSLPFASTTATNVPLINLHYRVFDGGQTAARVSRAAAAVEQADAGTRTARAMLIDATAKAYFDLAEAIASASVAGRTYDGARAHLADAERLLTAGQVARADVLAAQADVAGRRVAQMSAGHAIAVAQVALDAVLGLSLDTLHLPTEPLDAPAPELRLATLLTSARTTRPELSVAHAALDAATYALDEAQRGRAPRVDVNVSNGNVEPAVAPGYRNQFSVGLSAVWSLFDGGAVGGRVDAARAGLERARLALEQRERDVDVEVHDAYLSLQDAAAQADAVAAYVASADESLRLAQLRYRGGVGTVLELQDAEVRDAAANQSLVSARIAVRKGLIHARYTAGLL